MTSALVPSPQEDGPEDDVPMSFFEHLTELRKRLIRTALGVSVAFCACYAVRGYIFNLIVRPFAKAWAAIRARIESGEINIGSLDVNQLRPELQSLAALDKFVTDLKIAGTASIFLAAPIIFYHAWMFISPGLYRRERRVVIPFAATSAVMFITGGLFCYLFVLPIATEFFIGYAFDGVSEDVVPVIPRFTYPDYATYVTRLLIGFGMMFEFPLAIFFLAKAGIVTHRSLLKHWRVSTVVVFLISGFLTPPDPVTLFLMACPMMALYFISVGVAYAVRDPAVEAFEAAQNNNRDEDDDGEETGVP